MTRTRTLAAGAAALVATALASTTLAVGAAPAVANAPWHTATATLTASTTTFDGTMAPGFHPWPLHSKCPQPLRDVRN